MVPFLCIPIMLCTTHLRVEHAVLEKISFYP